MASKANQRTGEAVWSKMTKMVHDQYRHLYTMKFHHHHVMQNAEFFALTYGALVTQLISDCEDLEMVNASLDKMGYSIGIRLIDEFCAKNPLTVCTSFSASMEIITQVAFKMFFGNVIEIVHWNDKMNECTLNVNDIPMSMFVELPKQFQKTLWYSNLICGVLRGALEMVMMKIKVEFISDSLRDNDEMSLLKVEFKGMISDEMDDDYKED